MCVKHVLYLFNPDTCMFDALASRGHASSRAVEVEQRNRQHLLLLLAHDLVVVRRVGRAAVHVALAIKGGPAVLLGRMDRKPVCIVPGFQRDAVSSQILPVEELAMRRGTAVPELVARG